MSILEAMRMVSSRITILLCAILLLAVLPFGCASEPLDEPIYFTEVNSDEIYLGGAQLLIPAYGELYTTASDVVECTLADTFYLIDSPSTTGEILGFADNGFCRLTYTDITLDRICLLNTSMTISVDGADVPAVIQVQIYKNGIADPASLVGDQFTVGDAVEALPIVCLVELLNTNDYIEIYVASNHADTTVNVHTLTLIATTVD